MGYSPESFLQSPMIALAVSLLCLFAGIYFIFRNVALLRDKEKLYTYLETTPKAKIWVDKLGIDRTAALTVKYFIPLGFLISLVLILVGLVRAYMVLSGRVIYQTNWWNNTDPSGSSPRGWNPFKR